jgi:hypothetical protein
MTTKWVLLKTIQREPDNKLACYAMADILEEQGHGDLAFSYRWMGWYDRRPGTREGKRLRKRFVWYRQGASFAFFDDEAERYDSLPHARLPALLFTTLAGHAQQHLLYATWQQAVVDLAKALAGVLALVSPPAERKEG